MSRDRTIVAIGCTVDADYSFLLPLTCLFWRRIGFEPLAIIVGGERKPDGTKNDGSMEWFTDPRARVAFEALREHRIPTYSISAVDGYPARTTAQHCRQHAACIRTILNFDSPVEVQLELQPDDWIMPADADLWPLKRALYQRHEGSPFKLVSYYWQGDHFLGKSAFLRACQERRRGQTIPICHAAMRAKTWREVYRLEPERVADAVKRTLDWWFEQMAPKNDTNLWMSDQDTLTYNLCCQTWFPTGMPPHHLGAAFEAGEVLFVGRVGHPPVDRLDRGGPPSDWWQGDFDAAKWVDAHLLKEPYTEGNWECLLRIIDVLLPDHARWARSYRAAFVAARSR